MSYRYPTDKYHASSITDASILRQSIQPVLEEIHGRLNEHNIKGETFPAERRGTGMLYDFHYARESADMGIAGSDWTPVGGVNSWRIPESGTWTRVGSMMVDWTGGEDQAWIIGWLAYGLVPAGGTVAFSLAGTSGNKPRVQFALRVNGQILSESVTGTEAEYEGSPIMAAPVEPITHAAADYVSTDYRTVPGTAALNWHVRAVRLQTVMPVPQGTVTVEIVARRIGATDAVGTMDEVEPVYVFNRKLLAVQMKQSAYGADTTIETPSVTFPTDGSSYTADAFHDDTLNAIRLSMNQLEAANIQTAGLRREHIPTGGQVMGAEQTDLTAGSSTSRVYPGWGSNGTVGVGNWDEVSNGGGGPLRVTGPWDYTEVPAFVLILANVAFRKAYGGTYAAERYGVFAVAGQYAGGTNFKEDDAEAHVNNPNLLPGASDQFDCDTDVPLLEFFDFRSAPPPDAVAFYRVLVAADGSPAGAGCSWQNSSIQVLHFHG